MKLIMLVGVPGTGKSTWCDQMDDGSWEFVSTDSFLEYRAEVEDISYSDSLNKYMKQAEETMYLDLQDYVKEGLDIIWDQTNLTKESRARKLSLIPSSYEKECIVFTIPENHREIVEGRVTKSIPWKVIKGMRSRFQYPAHDEGFTKITHVNMFDR
jgi:predicted kinase